MASDEQRRRKSRSSSSWPALRGHSSPAVRIVTLGAFVIRMGMSFVPVLACQSHGATADGINNAVAQSSAQRSGAATAPAPPVGPTLEIVGIAPGRFALKSAPGVRVAVQARMERRSGDGTWPSGTPFELRQDCGVPAAPPNCLEIAPGATFVPLSWNGVCGSCCNAESPDRLEAGPYRLVVSACGNGALSWPSETFDVPATGEALERQRAAAAIESATAAQLNKANTSDDAAPTQSRIANVPVVAGTEAALAPLTIQALAAWLRDPGGFDDRVMKRCLRGNAFGFRVTRATPGVGREETDIAIDLRCNSIAVINEEGSRIRRTDAFFDESRPAALALLAQALPGVALPAR